MAVIILVRQDNYSVCTNHNYIGSCTIEYTCCNLTFCV